MLVNTTANLEIAKVTKTEKELSDLEEVFKSGGIDTKGFAATIFQLWGMLDSQLIEKSFLESKKLKKIKTVVKKIKEKSGIAILITMSPDFFANHFYSYGFDHVYASCFPKKNEKLDLNKILTPDDKPSIVMDLCKKYNCTLDKCVAFGDSMSDYPLFEKLKETVAINGDPKIDAAAKYSYKGNDLEEAINLFSLL
ncbi:MAG: HAD-IB family phosphatase [Desulfobacteraceae bacterium]|nr:HAD-IB family phosphatase [Desulfobacteraceae bacterium]